VSACPVTPYRHWKKVGSDMFFRIQEAATSNEEGLAKPKINLLLATNERYRKELHIVAGLIYKRRIHGRKEIYFNWMSILTHSPDKTIASSHRFESQAVYGLISFRRYCPYLKI
jgi:hypothetical protein